jgi:hypothetical protein
MHGDYPRRQGEDLVEIAGVHDDRRAGGRRGAQTGVHRRRRANVETSRWILGHDYRWPITQLAGEDDLLLVSTRQRARGHVRRRRANIELANEALRTLSTLAPVNSPAPVTGALQSDIFGERKTKYQALAMAILCDERWHAPSLEHSTNGSHPSSYRAQEKLMTRILERGDPNDLMLSSLETRVEHSFHAVNVRHRYGGKAKHNFSRCGGRLIHVRRPRWSAEHRPGETMRGRIPRRRREYRSAVAQHRDLIGNAECLRELVRDEDD